MGPALSSGFLSMKWLGVLLLPPGWDASPSQGYPQHICWYPFVHNDPGQGSSPDHSESGVERTNHEATAPPQRTMKTPR